MNILLLSCSIQPKNLKFEDCISTQEITNDFASSIMNSALDLLFQIINLWQDFPSISEAISKLKYELMPKLDSESWHPMLIQKKDKLNDLISTIKANPTRKHIVPKRKKEIKILRLYDPELDENFDPSVKKRHEASKEKQEMAKLNHKLKREKKAAKKDLRADAAFLAKQKAKERREKDSERMRKTKAILGGLGGQEGEYRQLQRQKKKRK